MGDLEQTLALYPLLAFGVVFLAGSGLLCLALRADQHPLVLGFAGGHADGDRTRAFLFSLCFVLGLALTFTALGAAAPCSVPSSAASAAVGTWPSVSWPWSWAGT